MQPTGALLVFAVLSAAQALATVPAAFADITIGDARAFPESIAVTASGEVIASSYAMGTIYRALPGATTAQPWILPATSGLGEASGVLVDEMGRRLLICGATTSGTPELRTFDLDSGAPVSQYPLPGGGHCNDATIGPGGAVFITDSGKGRVLKLTGNALTVWAQGPRLAGANGIAAAPGGNALLVTATPSSALLSIAVKPDGSAGLVTPLMTSQALQDPDGLHASLPNTFLLAEPEAGRVEEIAIAPGTATVTQLEAGLKNPTAAVLGGNGVYIVTSKLPLRIPANLTKDEGPFTITVVPLAH